MLRLKNNLSKCNKNLKDIITKKIKYVNQVMSQKCYRRKHIVYDFSFFIKK